MRRLSLSLATALMLWIVGDHAILAQNPPDNCGPRYRRDPAAANRAREAKKAELRRRGFPGRFLHLLDREECVACVEMASDAFHIMVVYNDDANAPTDSKGRRWTQHTFKWDPQSERWAREQLAAGKIRSFYIMNTATRCQCCPDVNDDSKTDASYSDWNEELGVHMSHVIPYDDPSDLGPLPQDLEDPPPGWTEVPPTIEQFFKPPKRTVHAICQKCQGLADKWNSAADTRDYLWDRKLTLQEGIAITENAMANRRNQIARLEYQQLFASTASAERQKQIDELKQVNEQQQAGIEREERRLAEVDKQIAEQNARMAALMKELQACEEACKTTAANTAAPPPVTASTRPNPPPSPPATPVTPPAPPPQQPGTTPANTPPAMCPDCQAAAAEAARIRSEIEARNAELNRLRGIQSGNRANIANLVQLRLDAAGRNDQARVEQYEESIRDLQARNKELREQEFKLSEEISALNEALEKAGRDVDACNSRCGDVNRDVPRGTGNVGTGTTGARPKLYVPPLRAVAACKECEALANQLRAEHQELERRAERVNNAAENFDEFEDQRAKVADLQRQLDACNRKCATTADNTNTNATNTTGTGTTGSGTPTATGTAGTTPTVTPRAACPDCAKIAAEADRIRADIEARQAEVNRLQSEHGGNSANLENLKQLRLEAAQRGDQARVQEYEQRIGELQAANKSLRQQQFEAEQQIQDLNDALSALGRNVDACNSRCGGMSRELPTGTTGVANPGTGLGTRRVVSVPPLRIDPGCKECEALADELRKEHQELQRRAERANNVGVDFEEFEEQRVKVQQLQDRLDGCSEKCKKPATTDRPNTTSSIGTPADCYGDACAPEWKACSADGSCEPIDRDCGVPGTCTAEGNPCALTGTCPETDPGVAGGACYANGSCNDYFSNPQSWGESVRVDIEVRIQLKATDVLDPADYAGLNATAASPSIVIPAFEQKDVRSWFNPLGLLARRLGDQIDRWRASMGPRPLLRPRDLEAVSAYSSGEQLGLPRGVHLLLTDRGGSTGKTLGLQILNLTGRPVRLAAKPLVVEPVRQQAQQQIQQAFNRLAKAAPVRLDLAAYCLEFLKAPPGANQILRLAPQAVQQKYASMSKVLRSAYRVQKAGLLNPDSSPAAYTDSIKQWALWAVEQRLNEKSFTEAFIGHTKKNVEAAGQQFPRQAEDMIRKVSPNRWRDIARILQGAGLPVPR